MNINYIINYIKDEYQFSAINFRADLNFCFLDYKIHLESIIPKYTHLCYVM